MAVMNLTSANINETIENNDIVIVDFWASWCGPCMAFKPIFHKVSEKHPDIVFASCNTEEEMELAAMFQIRSIPTLMIFREKILIFAQPGMLPEDVLEDLIGKVLALDMDEVRAEIAKQEKEQAANA